MENKISQKAANTFLLDPFLEGIKNDFGNIASLENIPNPLMFLSYESWHTFSNWHAICGGK